LVAIVGGAVLVSAGPISVARAATHELVIAKFSFGPPSLTITAGDTVTWTNLDAALHSVTSVNGAFDSGEFGEGETFSFTFTTPGTYDYLCTPHPQMTGQIVVVAGAADPSAPAESATPSVPAASAAPASAAPSGQVPNVAMARPEDGTSLRFIGAVLLVAGALLLARRGRQRMPVS
jgi:amicyanin